MKKIIAMIMAALMCASMCACSEQTADALEGDMLTGTMSNALGYQYDEYEGHGYAIYNDGGYITVEIGDWSKCQSVAMDSNFTYTEGGIIFHKEVAVNLYKQDKDSQPNIMYVIYTDYESQETGVYFMHDRNVYEKVAYTIDERNNTMSFDIDLGHNAKGDMYIFNADYVDE